MLNLSLKLMLLILAVAIADTLTYHEDDVVDLNSYHPEENPHRLRLWLTISAQKRFLEVSWKNAPAKEGDNILLTTQEPQTFQRVQMPTGTPLAQFDGVEGSGYVPFDGYTTPAYNRRRSVPNRDASDGSGAGALDSNFGNALNTPTTTKPTKPREYWISNNGKNDIVAAVKPSATSQWFTTGVPFDYALSRNVTSNTTCYGYWASYINGTGDILASTCIRAYPRWMNELKSAVGGFRIRDLFIPGTHDSASYRRNFDPLLQETLVTKYALCQDDDVMGQLMHGARYLDIRVGYYRNTPEKFFINHGIVRQGPLKDVIEQVKNFVMETNEIVIFGLKEFPVGFGRGPGVHRLLVNYLQQHFGHLIVHPSATWRASLRDIWSRQENIILAYDKSAVVQEHPEVLFNAVEQRWGNVQTWTRLEQHLRTISRVDVSRLSSRPMADMAELTPQTFDVVLDKYGGLRKMADRINWRISQLYRDHLGENANIVAADFIRGTTLVETAIDFNKRKVVIY